MIQNVESQKEKNDDELFEKAIHDENWSTIEQLANKGYQKAYIPLANHYLQSSSTHSLADKWAQRAKSYDITGANAIIEKMKLYGYYD